MKEIYIVNTNSRSLKKIKKELKLELPLHAAFRESIYVLLFNSTTGTASDFARIESITIIDDSPVKPEDSKLLIKISEIVNLMDPIQISKKNPPLYTRFDTIFTCINNGEELKEKTPISQREIELLTTSYLEQGIQYSANQKLEEAKEVFEACLDLDPDNDQVHFYLANIFVDTGKLDLALYHYFNSIHLNNTFVPALDYTGLAYIHKNELEKALNIWGESLKQKPDGEFALINRGKTHIQLKNYEEAAIDLNKAVAVNPKNMFTRNLLGVVYANLNEIETAISHWQTVIENGKDDEYLHLNLARALAENKNYKEALREYNMLLELFPEDHELHTVVQKTIKKLQDELKTENTFKGNDDKDYINRILEKFKILLSFSNKKHKINLNKLMEYLNDFNFIDRDVSEIHFDEKEDEDFVFIPEKTKLIIGKKGCKSTRSMRSILRKVVDMIPVIDEIEEVQLKTIPLGKQDAIDEQRLLDAIEKAREMVAEEPNNEWAHYSVGSLEAQMGNFEEAIKFFSSAAAINPNNAISLYALGLANVRLEKLEEGAEALKRAIISKPDARLQAVYDEWNFKDSLAYFGLGDVLIRMSKFKEAIAVFQKGLSIDATSALAHFQMGTCFEVTGELDKAVESLTNSLSLDPDFSYAYSKLGIVYYKQQKFSESFSMLQKAVTYETADSEAFYYLAEAAYKLNKTQEARSAWNIVLEITTSDDIYYKKSEERLSGDK